MPDMGQLRFIAIITSIILLIIAAIGALGLAQDLSYQTVTGNELIHLWDEAKLDSLLLLYRPFAVSNPEHPVTQFLKAALEKDGNIAVQGYLAVVQQNGNSEVIPRAMKRLSNYYQTVGNLSEAIRWERRLEVEYPDFLTPPTASTASIPTIPEFDNEFASNEGTDYYTLQLGAFQNLENAQRLLEKAQTAGLLGQIQEQHFRGQALFLVWVGKFTTSKEADDKGKQLVSEQQMEYKVVKYQPENN